MTDKQTTGPAPVEDVSAYADSPGLIIMSGPTGPGPHPTTRAEPPEGLIAVQMDLGPESNASLKPIFGTAVLPNGEVPWASKRPGSKADG